MDNHKLLDVAPGAARIPDQRGLLPLHYVAAFCHTSIDFLCRLFEEYPEVVLKQSH